MRNLASIFDRELRRSCFEMKQYVGHLKHALRAPIIGLYNDVHSLPIHPLILEGSINAKFGFVALLRARTWLTAGHVTFS